MNGEGNNIRENLLRSIIQTANTALSQNGYTQIKTDLDRLTGATYQSENWDYAQNHPTAATAYYSGNMAFKIRGDDKNPPTPLHVIIVFGVKYTDGSDTAVKEIVSVSKEIVTLHSTAQKLQGVISKWYFILRNLALLVLILVLIYSGIRIVIGSTAGEKAKYKERLKDWLVAICLIFVMHYIMVFAIELVERITELVRSSTGPNVNAAVIELTDTQYDNALKIIDSEEYDISNIGTLVGKTLIWKTDLAGLFRIQSQMVGEGTAKWVGFSLCYCALVLFTLFFSWTYLKRILYMAFLTMVAPLVAMTYPIDKITDGKAQAFNAWLKEYIFNLMIQPLHLLLYTILVSSAFELASSAPIYALVAIGFMMPAEKLMRKFFGFEKAHTPGLLGGAAGAALLMSGMQSLFKPKNNKGKQDNGKAKDQNKVKFSNKNSVDTMDAVAGGKKPTVHGNVGGFSGDSSSDEGGNNPSLGGALNDEYMDSTTLGSEHVDHNGIGSAGTEDPENLLDEGTLPISTFEQTNKATEAYNRPKHISFDEEKANNLKKKRKENKKKIKGAIGAVTRSAGRQLAGNALSNFHPARWTGQVLMGTIGGVGGLMAGIVSGDPSKAFQYTTTGALAGNAMAKSLDGKQVLDVQQLKEEAQMGYYGEEYKNVVIEKQRKQWEKNSLNINYLRQTMGVETQEAKEILKTTGGLCFDNGITNVEDVATIHKLTNGQDSISFNQAVAARNYAKNRLPSNPDQMTEETKAQYIRRWKKEYERAGYENADELANKAFDLAIRFNKTQSGLTKNP